ncbi:ATP-dependent DNA helicase PIF1-like protein, partial [Tanacetum coccineum]
MRDSESLHALLQREGINVTMFTDWFELNERDPATQYMGIKWQNLSEDILHKKRKLFNYLDLQLTDVQIRNYCQLEIQELLHRYGRSLEDFKDLPWHDPSLLTNMDNRLIREALYFDIKKASLNTNNSIPWKTFLYKTIISRLRSERMIVLAVASSGIDSLLLSTGRTAHSRFVIPLDLMENITCGIKQNTHLAELLQEVQLVIWDEGPMTQRYAFEHRVNEYSVNGALDTSKQEFDRWVLAMGDGNLPVKIKEGEDEPTWIGIPERQTDEEYLKERVILTLRNEDGGAINEFMFKKLSGEAVTYNSADEIYKASADNIDQHQLYP